MRRGSLDRSRHIVALVAIGLCTPGLAEAQEPKEVTELAELEELEPPRQILGGRLGLEAGGGLSPGGVHVAGSYLYRATEVDWLDSSASFTFGSGAPRCFRDRDDDVVCDHGIASGFAAEIALAVRRHFAVRDRFEPFARLGIAVRLIGFGEDNVTGIGLPLLGSVGVRARVHRSVSVLAVADLRTGWSIFNRGLGAEPHASISFSAGVEFEVD